MKYSERDQLVAGLRELADFLDTPKAMELPMNIWYAPKVTLTSRFYASDDCDPKVELAKAARILGSADKSYRYSDFELIKKFGDGMVELKFETNRENVCVKKVIEVKQVPRKVWVEIPGETVDEEVIEWECNEPLLAN